METETLSPVVPPRRKKTPKLESRTNLKESGTAVADESALKDELSTAGTASVSTSLSCKSFGEKCSNRAMCEGKDDVAVKSQLPPHSRANTYQEPPFNSSRSVQDLSCQESFSSSGSYSTESTELRPGQTKHKPARPPNPPKWPRKEPNVMPSGEKSPSATALQPACSSKHGPGGGQSTSKPVQENKCTIINSREIIIERKRSKDDTNVKRSLTSKSCRPLYVRENSNSKEQTTVTFSVLSKAQSLLSRVKASTLPRFGTSSAQLKSSPHSPPARPPRPILPSSSRSTCVKNKNATSEPALEHTYTYVDVSLGWKNKHSSRFQTWSSMPNSELGRSHICCKMIKCMHLTDYSGVFTDYNTGCFFFFFFCVSSMLNNNRYMCIHMRSVIKIVLNA